MTPPPTSAVHYTYRWHDHSILLRWLRGPVVLRLARTLPATITPNQVTLFGQTVIWAAFVACAVTPQPGRLVLLALGGSYLLYAVADCVDGEFARHTSRTSRAGELLDHGLDSISLPLIALGFGLVTRQPPWVTLTSTAAVAVIDFATFVHGYRVGYVHLGAVGLNEALVLGAVVCGAGALAGVDLLARPLAGGVSVGGILLLGMALGSLGALAGMRALAATPADFAGMTIMLLAIAAWYVDGDLSVLVTGLLITAVNAYLVCALTCGRLRGGRVPLSDWPLTLLIVTGAATSIALRLDARHQVLAALIVWSYVLARGGSTFVRTLRLLR